MCFIFVNDRIIFLTGYYGMFIRRRLTINGNKNKYVTQFIEYISRDNRGSTEQ